jgi:predicted CopG family antitoxin
MHSRHTITLNREAYDKLSHLGRFGESYSQLILRLLQELELKHKGENGNC